MFLHKIIQVFTKINYRYNGVKQKGTIVLFQRRRKIPACCAKKIPKITHCSATTPKGTMKLL